MGQRVTYTFVGSDRFSASARKIVKANNKVKRSMKQVGTAARLQSRATGGLGAALGGLTTRQLGFAAVGAAAVKASRSFATFEQGIENTLGLLEDEEAIRKFKDRIVEASSEANKLGFKVDDLGTAMFNSVSLIDDTALAIDAFKESQVLAIGGAGSLQSSVKGVTRLMNAYGINVLSAKDATIGLLVAQQKGGLDINQFGENIGKVSSSAAEAGIELPELLAVFARVSKAISPEQTATGIKAILKALTDPAKDVIPDLRRLNIPFGAEPVAEAGLVNILKRIRTIGEVAPDALRALIPEQEAFNAAAVLGLEALEDVKRTRALIEKELVDDTIRQRTFTRQLETQQRTTDRFTGTLNQLAVSAGRAFTGDVKQATEFMTSLTEGAGGDDFFTLYRRVLLGGAGQFTGVPEDDPGFIDVRTGELRGKANLQIELNILAPDVRVETKGAKLVGQIPGLEIGVNYPESTR